ncbi:hypothetical protein OGV29_11605 [Citrobacter sp. Cb013]|uniref:hypothetical protein n=1 Tax=Citrobacter sp. Cb013 TaxID=2985013 RepID=UPI00257C3083|nr:hypothetical protein [Citrobacter sp. Cb013]MDM3389439.1 hypothetical protein [Citrobacter sp. Cb013]
MIFQNIQTYYITSDKHKVIPRYVRYDVIKLDDNAYIVNVIGDQQRGISPPYSLVMLDKITITKAEYLDKYQIGSFTGVRTQSPPTFEGYITEHLQEHRNQLD